MLTHTWLTHTWQYALENGILVQLHLPTLQPWCAHQFLMVGALLKFGVLWEIITYAQLMLTLVEGDDA